MGLDEYFNKMILPIKDNLDLKGKWVSVDKYEIAERYNVGLSYSVMQG